MTPPTTTTRRETLLPRRVFPSVPAPLLALLVLALGLAPAFLLGTPGERTATTASSAAPSAPSNGATPEASFAVVGARVFDGERLLDDATVLVRDGRIEAVGAAVEIPGDLRRVDGSGATLLPGLIDAHTHTWGDALERAVAFGVTTHLDQFTDPGSAADLRSRRGQRSERPRADLFSAGVLATAPGGHGTQFGLPIPTLETPGEADAWVEARAAEGSEWIKIVLEDGSSHGRRIPTLDAATVEALVEAAHARDLLAVVHPGHRADALTALEAGADGLVHWVNDPRPAAALVEAVADRGTFVIPTLTILESLHDRPGGAAVTEDPRLAERLRPDETANLRRGFPTPGDDLPPFVDVLASVGALHRAGVPVLAGSDARNPGTAYGASLHRELELLVEAGLEPTDALAAATAVPARIFGLDDRGRIAPGLTADLVLVEGDPTTDVTATRNLLRAWKDGVAVDLDGERSTDSAATDEGSGTDGDRAAVEPGWIARFDEPRSEDAWNDGGNDGTPTARLGHGWMISTDARQGGTSSAEMAVVDGALRITGTITGDAPYPWAGAMWFAGSPPMTAADLSRGRGIAFAARADGRDHVLMVFAERLGPLPQLVALPTAQEWTRREVTWESLGLDGTDVQAVLFGGPAAPGAPGGDFTLWIDDLELLATDAPAETGDRSRDGQNGQDS